MTDETTTEDTLNVSFIGVRTSGNKRQLAYQVDGELLFVPVDTKTYLAGERVVKAAAGAIDMYGKAVKQGLIEVAE